MADSWWHSLPDSFIKSHPIPLITPLPRDSNIVIMCEHKEFLGQAQSIIICVARKNLNNREIHQESKQLCENLRAWGERVSKIRPLNLTPITEQDWFCVFVHLLWHSMVLLSNRIFLVHFLKLKSNSQPQAFFDQFNEINMQQSLQECQVSTTEILNILKNVILKNNSFDLDCQPSVPVIMMQTCIYLGILSQFGDSDIVRQDASSDYSLVKLYLRKLGDSTLATSHHMVNELEKIEISGWAKEPESVLLFCIWNLTIDIRKK
ncbi:hypothetical protein HK096_004851 [Nowakowskiella sp. JEL0078]|nr:hypothetical protein HK096_004851 [Nowakowskiella sp. JEL0078]